MRIAVYAIAKNEERHVAGFLESVRDADEIVVLDTGSTDRTVELLARGDARVFCESISPWRFDAARNRCLSLVSPEVEACISLDLDEAPRAGWRRQLEDAWTPGTTRLKYEYIWSHAPDGRPDVAFWADKIHARHGYRWKQPAHEILEPVGILEKTGFSRLSIDHFPDRLKARGDYVALMELAVRESPTDSRCSYFLGREYCSHRRYEAALREFERYLSLPSAAWRPERASAMRYAGLCCRHLGQAEEELRWLRRACEEAPQEREPWVELGLAHLRRGDFALAYEAARRALEIVHRPQTYLSRNFAWGSRPHELMGVAAYHLGLLPEAAEHFRLALTHDPQDEQLRMYHEQVIRRLSADP
jgi:glycosyltransferase involved in cell wall biosynthesis